MTATDAIDHCVASLWNSVDKKTSLLDALRVDKHPSKSLKDIVELLFMLLETYEKSKGSSKGEFVKYCH